MNDDAPNQEAAARPGMPARVALRAIDAGLRALQGLRGRVAPPASDEEGAERGSRRGQAAAVDEPAAVVATARPRKTLLHRALIILMCLLIGGVAGMLISHRGFSKHLDSQAKRIDFLEDEVRQSRKDEARKLVAQRKLLKEITEYRDALSEAQDEAEELKRQIAELNARLTPARDASRPLQSGPGAAPTTARPSVARPNAAPKTGTCVTGTENPSGNLLDCIGKFNRP